MKYRIEIDGLRAIAVLSVIIFHFFPSRFSMGYLGVDLFFVISGFLISGILKENISTGTFSFKSFYIRRIKRILPATLIVLTTTTVAAYFLLIAPDLVRFSKSIIATLGFSANIYFWLTGGYFGTNDELKPLLHMWSLSVEEQFYLFFPLTLFIIFKYTNSSPKRILLIALISTASYALNTYLISIGGEKPSFFLVPTRAWQFGIGAMCALIPSLSLKNKFSCEIFSALGMTLILTNFYKSIPHIPTATMLSVGAGLLLWQSGSSGSLVNRFLSTRIITFIGLISFSLYLWHWPIISLTKYISIEEPSNASILTGLITTFIISTLSWKYIEEPFRKKIPEPKVLIFTGMAYTLLLSTSILIITNNGFASRHSTQANALAQAVDSNYRCPVGKYRPYGGSRACSIGEETHAEYDSVLLGNSHAQMYGPAYSESLYKIGRKGLIVPLNGCLPTTDININTSCLNLAKLNYNAVIKDEKIKKVIIALTWHTGKLIDSRGKKILDTDFAQRKSSLLKLIMDIESHGKTAFLIGPIQIPHYDFASVVSRKIVFAEGHSVSLSVPRSLFDEKYSDAIAFFKEHIRESLLLPHTNLCDANSCYFGDSESAFFADSNHLSLDGAKKMTNLFDSALIDNKQAHTQLNR